MRMSKKDLQQKIDGYFNLCDEKGKPYTFSGLANTLGMERVGNLCPNEVCPVGQMKYPLYMKTLSLIKCPAGHKGKLRFILTVVNTSLRSNFMLSTAKRFI